MRGERKLLRDAFSQHAKSYIYDSGLLYKTTRFYFKCDLNYGLINI